jgi:hypothetical protein
MYIDALVPIRHRVVLTVKQVLLLWGILELEPDAPGSGSKEPMSQSMINYSS